jgi:hypothetical protein
VAVSLVAAMTCLPGVHLEMGEVDEVPLHGSDDEIGATSVCHDHEPDVGRRRAQTTNRSSARRRNTRNASFDEGRLVTGRHDYGDFIDAIHSTNPSPRATERPRYHDGFVPLRNHPPDCLIAVNGSVPPSAAYTPPQLIIRTNHARSRAGLIEDGKSIQVWLDQSSDAEIPCRKRRHRFPKIAASTLTGWRGDRSEGDGDGDCFVERPGEGIARDARQRPRTKSTGV